MTEAGKKVISMWDLRGSEMRTILTSWHGFPAFAKFIGCGRQTPYNQANQPLVRPMWREQMIAYLGEENYFRELLKLRRAAGEASDELEAYFAELISRRVKKPVAASPGSIEVN